MTVLHMAVPHTREEANHTTVLATKDLPTSDHPMTVLRMNPVPLHLTDSTALHQVHPTAAPPTNVPRALPTADPHHQTPAPAEVPSVEDPRRLPAPPVHRKCPHRLSPKAGPRNGNPVCAAHSTLKSQPGTRSGSRPCRTRSLRPEVGRRRRRIRITVVARRRRGTVRPVDQRGMDHRLRMGKARNTRRRKRVIRGSTWRELRGLRWVLPGVPL